LLKDNEIVDLGYFGNELVSYLVQNRGKYVSIETLRDIIWQGREIHTQISECV